MARKTNDDSSLSHTKLKKKVDEMKEIAGVVVELIEYGG